MHKDFKKIVPGRFLVTFGHINTLQKELHCFVVGKSQTWTPLILMAPFITRKKNCSVYKVLGTQNNQLELTVSTQKYATGPEILAKTSQEIIGAGSRSEELFGTKT